MSSLSEKLIKIIDERIEKKLSKSNFITKFTGIVTEVSGDNRNLKVKLAGTDTIFSFLNKTGEKVSVGEGVKIESIGGNLSAGFVSERFGKSEKNNMFLNGLLTFGGGIINSIDNSATIAAFTGVNNRAYIEAGTDPFVNRRQLVLGNISVALIDALILAQTTDGSTWTTYRIFGEHFKPFVTGSYTGNYNTTPTQTIYLGFTPSAVIIAKNGTALMYMSGNAGISIVENGFAISDTNTNTLNV